MSFVDVHTHLDYIQHDTIENVLKRAKESGVNVIINNGTNPAKNRISLELAEKYPCVKAALGLYPTDALKMTDSEIDAELDFIKVNNDKIIALGEVGIDYHWIKDANEQKREREIFEKVLKLAEKLKKPILVHSRKAEEDAIEMIKNFKVKKVIMHCFGGNLKLVPKIVDFGWSFSIPANVVRDNHFQKIVEMVPTTQILTETDAPFLGPEKNIPNEPMNIAKAVSMIAKIKKMTPEEMEQVIFLNYQRLFV